MICPHHCVCQYAHRMDLSISRWIYAVETRQRKGHEFTGSSEDPTNDNEVKLCKITSLNDLRPNIDSLRSTLTMKLRRTTMNC